MLLFRNRLLPLFFCWLYLVINALPGLAQNACTLPKTGGFTVPKRVCAGSPVTITNPLATLSNVGYTFEYNGNGIPANPQSSPKNTYAKPGSYTILQTGSTGGTGAVACEVIEVLPIKPVSYSVTVCPGRKATLTYTLDAETARYDKLQINWGDGLPPTDIPLTGNVVTSMVTHTYPGPGTPVITVTGSHLGACAVASPSQQPTVTNTAAPAVFISELTSSATSVGLRYQSTLGAVLTLYQRDGSGNYNPTGQTATSTGSGVFTINGVPSTNVNCFQVGVQDACGGAELRSAGVCSVPLSVSAGDKQNTVTWPTYTGTDLIRIYRINRDGFSVGSRTSSAPFVDATNIQCGVKYCYDVSLKLDNNYGTMVYSAPVCVIGQNNEPPKPPTKAFVSVEADGVKLQASLPATVPTAYTLLVTRADGPGGPFSPIGQAITDGTYTDKTANSAAQSYCYRTAIQTDCGKISDYTAPACTVHLTTPNNSALDWTASSPFSGTGVSYYQIIRIDPTTGISNKLPVGGNTHWEPTPDAADTQTYTYQIVATDANGIESYSNPILVLLAPKLFVPDAFSPNGDGNNDDFFAKGSFWESASMTVYTRWGDVVFSTTKFGPGPKKEDGIVTEPWNGLMANGSPAPMGYYAYRLEIKDLKGQTYVRAGRLLLIR